MSDREPSDFATALRAAISARGLSLDQIRRSLARHGITVSVATLSYWQSGRSRPERASSLAAIGPLEETLGLPRGFLGSRLPPLRRSLAAPTDSYSSSSLEPGDPQQDRAAAAVAQLGLSFDDGLARVSYHDRVEFRKDRTEGPRYVRTVFTAQREGVDRFPVWLESDDPDCYPIVTALTNCRVGVIREFPELAGVAVELIFDRPLHLGETTLVEHCLELVGQRRPQRMLRRVLGTPTRELVLEVKFARAALPALAHELVIVGGEERRRELSVYPTIQSLFTDCVPGRYSVHWEWDPSPD